jgi:ribonuclease D
MPSIKYKFYQNDIPSEFLNCNSVAIDTEAMGLRHQRDRLCLVQLCFGDDIAHLVKFSANNYEAPNLRRLLNNKEIKKIFHYARFDVGILQYYLNVDITNIFCTKIASKIARTYTEYHGLKELCNELLSVSISKSSQSSNWGAAKLTDAQMRYAAQDVLYLHELMDKLTNMLNSESRFELAKNCFDFLPHRVKLDLAGWELVDIFQH